jgi:hypothetical protein
MSVAGTWIARRSLRSSARPTNEAFVIARPPGCSFGSKASSEGTFMAISTFGWSTTGAPMAASDAITDALAVPRGYW